MANETILGIAMIVVALLLLVTVIVFIKFFIGSKPIPGPKPKSLVEGNLPDIAKAGSLHQYLMKCHKEFGDIFGIWMGSEYVVVVCSAEYFKEFQDSFNRPPSLFLLFAPLIGSKSIQYANFEDIRHRRLNYDRAMSHQAVVKYVDHFVSVADEFLSELDGKDENYHFNFTNLCAEFALKVDILTLFGQIQDDEKIQEFHENYKVCWSEMETRMTSLPAPESDREKEFKKALDGCQAFIKDIVKQRKDLEIDDENETFIDILLKASPDEETLISDSMTYIVGGFHTTACSLSWAFYFLASHNDVQEKAYEEILKVLGSNSFKMTHVSELVYLRQIFEETLRCAVIAPWGARFETEHKIVAGGYKIKKFTSVLTAFGVTLQREDYWPNPERFDPERFSEDAVKVRPYLMYQPFGYAGKRTCPGSRFAKVEALVCLAIILQKYRLELVSGQDIKPVYGLVTHTSHNVLIKAHPR